MRRHFWLSVSGEQAFPVAAGAHGALLGIEISEVPREFAGDKGARIEAFVDGLVILDLELLGEHFRHHIVQAVYGVCAVFGENKGLVDPIYLTEYAKNKKLVEMIEYAAETLSGIPSIIYGLVGMLFFCQFLGFKTSLLAGALTLVIMNLPTVMRTTQESLKTVPQSYRDGAFGLGAGKWRVIRTVVLPGCVDGVITGCILSIGRILGESAALLFTAGFAHALNGIFEGLTSPGASLTVALYVYAKEQGEFGVAFAIAAILMILTLLINFSATLVSRYFAKKREL